MHQIHIAGTLRGRQHECEALARLVDDVLGGRSRAMVLRGEAGVGKTALLRHLADQVSGWHVARAVGVQSEMELTHSGLHQLCAPLLDRLARLPAAQRDALATVFGLSHGPAPDRFMVGLATLTLLTDAAEERPLVCIVDDAQWLDHDSAHVLAFLAGRLFTERVAIVCAARSGAGEDGLRGVPELAITGLSDDDARALLLEHTHGPLDATVCDQLVAESHGNPLALVELPRTWNGAGIARGFGISDDRSVAGKVEQSYVRRLVELPRDSQLLVLAAAAEPLGDPELLRRAAEGLAVEMAALEPVVDAGLLRLRDRIEFAHPLVRSAAYRGAPPGTAVRRTARSPRRPTPEPTLTGVPGTAPGRRSVPTRTSRPSSSVRRAVRRLAEGWLRPRRS
jgi:hypothetical protein